MKYTTIIGYDADNITKNPFIKSVGGHTSLICDNLFREKINLYAFKTGAAECLEEIQKEQRKNKFYELFFERNDYKQREADLHKLGIELDINKMSVIDFAIQYGVELDYGKMLESLKETLNNNHLNENENEERPLPFTESMICLYQICKIKVLESTILDIFKDDIAYEDNNGNISLLIAIQNATDMIYMIGSYPYAYLRDDSFEKNIDNLQNKINSFKKIGHKEKQEILSQYTNLPIVFYQTTVANMIFDGVEEVDEYCEYINDIISQIVGCSCEIVGQLNNQEVEDSSNEVPIDEEDVTEMYQRNDDFKDPAIS